MTQGLKIEGGDKLGRTIIFAVNQEHAKFIVNCFTERYPEQPAGFISMIHNEVSHAQSMIKTFCDKYKENNPQIAVSVDMMDTGIDAIRILNLVFFKSVKSFLKFQNIKSNRGLPYATGEIYYCNWPQVVSKEGNKKMFLDTTWGHPFEQTWMSFIYQETVKGNIKTGVLLATPTEHDRFDHYPKEERREN